MRFFLSLLLVLGISSCTTVENDPTTNSAASLYRTRVDFAPPSRAERVTQLAYEKKVLSEKEASLAAELERLTAERGLAYAAVEEKFPDCRRQKHCLSSLSMGSAKRFEEYRQARAPLAELDSQIADLEAKQELWRRRYDLRVRAIFNRYLVREILETPSVKPVLSSVLVHSAEAFPDRLRLSKRMLSLAEPGLVPLLVGDLDFRMLGKPVDEAAVLVTLDVNLAHTSGPMRRYLVTFLVNTHQLDPQGYEAGFLETWGAKLADPERLKEVTYCGLYSIASPMLLPKIGPAKAKPCSEMRERLQSLRSSRYYDVGNPDYWLVPLAFQSL